MYKSLGYCFEEHDHRMWEMLGPRKCFSQSLEARSLKLKDYHFQTNEDCGGLSPGFKQRTILAVLLKAFCVVFRDEIWLSSAHVL